MSAAGIAGRGEHGGTGAIDNTDSGGPLKSIFCVGGHLIGILIAVKSGPPADIVTPTLGIAELHGG